MLFISININNFRSFKDLQIEDLKLVNLLVGKNSCGKTSVLEALFLLVGGNNPTLSVTVQNIRQPTIQSNDQFKYLFNDFNVSNKINVSAETTDSKKMHLEISSWIGPSEINNFSNSEDKENFLRQITTEVPKNYVMKGISYKFTGKSGKPSSHDFDVSFKTMPNYGRSEVPGGYITTKTISSMGQAVSDLITNKSEKEIVDILKEISDDIVDIKMGANNFVFVDIKGKKELMPINVMGDGIVKIVSMLATLRLMKNGILLIDEIENGLYFSSLKLLWKAIFKACRLYNVQIVATTHSYECIKSFCDAYDSNEKSGDEISLIRLDKKNNEFRVVSYNETNIKVAMENEMEVR